MRSAMRTGTSVIRTPAPIPACPRRAPFFGGAECHSLLRDLNDLAVTSPFGAEDMRDGRSLSNDLAAGVHFGTGGVREPAHDASTSRASNT